MEMEMTTKVGRSFVLFNEDEKRQLLRTMLQQQGQGQSVRGCAIALAGGERGQMLRFQNKYRNLVRSDPALVREVMTELSQAGITFRDPYAPRVSPQRGRPAGRRSVRRGLVNVTAALVQDLETLGGDEGELFLSQLAELVHVAVQPMDERQNGTFQRLATRYENLALEHQQLQKRADELQQQEWKKREQIAELIAETQPVFAEVLGELVAANRTFAGLDEAGKLTGLGAYVKKLETCLLALEAAAQSE